MTRQASAAVEVLSLQDARRLRLIPLVEDWAERVDRRRQVGEALKHLKPIQEKVLRMRFGFDGPERTLSYIGEDLGVGKERVRQIEGCALRRIRFPGVSNPLREYE